MRTNITIETTINAPLATVWELYTLPKHIVQWNAASNDWHTARAENNLKVGGMLTYRMEAKDRTAGFDFVGIYSEIIPNQLLAYSIGDGRKVRVNFSEYGRDTNVAIDFEAENHNSPEAQKEGWQAILTSFKEYAEEQNL